HPPPSPPFPYTTLFRSNNSILHADANGTGNLPIDSASVKELIDDNDETTIIGMAVSRKIDMTGADGWYWYQKGGMPVKMEAGRRSEEHTSELQSRGHLV